MAAVFWTAVTAAAIKYALSLQITLIYEYSVIVLAVLVFLLLWPSTRKAVDKLEMGQ